MLEEIPFSEPDKPSLQYPADNKLYIGCRSYDKTSADYSDMGMDELAFWRKYLLDEEIKYFTGEISEFTKRSVIVEFYSMCMINS